MITFKNKEGKWDIHLSLTWRQALVLVAVFIAVLVALRLM